MRIKVNVTKSDISKAGADCESCPIYMALQRTKLKKDWVVGLHRLYGPGTKETNLPAAALKFSASHFWGKEVKPFEFTINIRKELI